MPPHRLFFLFQRNFLFWNFPHFNPPLPLQRYMQFQYRPWCSSLKRIRASTEFFIKNFSLWWSLLFSTFGLPNYNPQERYMQFQWQFHPASLFPSHHPNLTTFPPFPNSQLHHSQTLPNFPPHQLPHLTNLPHPTFWSSPPSYFSHLSKLTTLSSTIKALQNNNIRPSLSTLVLREGSQYQNWKAKSLFSSPRKQSQTTGFELWFAKLHHWNMFMWVT